MIVVLVPARGAPHVLDVTAEQVVLLARNAHADIPHTSSIPPGVYASEFDEAWAVLTKDMFHARYFDSVNEGLRFYSAARHPLAAHQTGAVMALLKRLPFAVPDPHDEPAEQPDIRRA